MITIMTAVLICRGGLVERSLLWVHQPGCWSVRTLEGDLECVDENHVAPRHLSPPLCVIFACKPGSGRWATTLKVLEGLTREHPQVAFVALLELEGASAGARAAAVAQVLTCGADDAMSVSCDPVELRARVSRAVERMRVRSAALAMERPRPVHARRPRVDRSTRHLVGPARRVSLTAKEATIMEALLATPAVLSRADLGALLWTQDWQGTPKAIDNHIVNLRRKLRQACGEHWRIRTVRGEGFLLEEGGEEHLVEVDLRLPTSARSAIVASVQGEIAGREAPRTLSV